MVNLDVSGLEESPADFRKFLEEYVHEFKGLLTYEQNEEKSNLFDVGVPSDTNLFMLGILWAKWRMINSEDNSFHGDYFEDDDDN